MVLGSASGNTWASPDHGGVLHSGRLGLQRHVWLDDGRTNFCPAWRGSMLGLVWVRNDHAAHQVHIQHINFEEHSHAHLHVAHGHLHAVNIVVTVLALHREGQRIENILLQHRMMAVR